MSTSPPPESRRECAAAQDRDTCPCGVVSVCNCHLRLTSAITSIYTTEDEDE